MISMAYHLIMRNHKGKEIKVIHTTWTAKAIWHSQRFHEKLYWIFFLLVYLFIWKSNITLVNLNFNNGYWTKQWNNIEFYERMIYFNKRDNNNDPMLNAVVFFTIRAHFTNTLIKHRWWTLRYMVDCLITKFSLCNELSIRSKFNQLKLN